MSNIARIPFEIWETILDTLDRQDLLNFQNVCQEWYDVLIRYVMSGRLKNRAVVSMNICNRANINTFYILSRENLINKDFFY